MSLDSINFDQLLSNAVAHTGETEISLAAQAYLYGITPYITSVTVTDDAVQVGILPERHAEAQKVLDEFIERFGESEFMNEVNGFVIDAYNEAQFRSVLHKLLGW